MPDDDRRRLSVYLSAVSCLMFIGGPAPQHLKIGDQGFERRDDGR